MRSRDVSLAVSFTEVSRFISLAASMDKTVNLRIPPGLRRLMSATKRDRGFGSREENRRERGGSRGKREGRIRLDSRTASGKQENGIHPSELF